MRCLDHGQRGSAKGYGSVVWNNKPEKAHRAAYMGAHQCSLLSGVVVRHKCDNPRCVNPEHLELGTIADNNRDRDERGRTAIGERVATAKLTEAVVKEIREEYQQGGCSHRSLASKYGVDRRTIGRILSGKAWRHV